VDKKNTAVNSLVFHTSQPAWLFCGTNDGVVSDDDGVTME
jgi:hypothetical protein